MAGISLAGLFLLPGCSTYLNAVRVTPEDKTFKSEGAPYNLSFSQYEITITRRLTSCTNERDEAQMKIVTAAKATRREAADPSREYVIDFAALRSFFKTTDVAVEYHPNGTLKSVNASVEDKSAEFLKSSFSAIGKIAILSAGAAGDKAQACRSGVTELIVAADNAEKDLDKKTAVVANLTAMLTKRVEVATALGRARTDQERIELAKQVAALITAKAEVDVAQKTLEAAEKELTYESKAVWPPDGSTFEGQLLAPLTLKDIEKWGSPNEEGLEVLGATTGVWALIKPDGPMAGHAICNAGDCPGDKTTGLKFRMPRSGRLLLCSNATCEGKGVVIAQDPGLFSQLGPVMTLPLRNYPLMNQTVVLTFNEAGQPTKVGYTSQAAAEKLADVANTFVDEYGKVRQARKPKTELDLVKEETELLEARAKLASAKKTLEPPSQQAQAEAALRADTTLLNAELAKLEAQAALDKARALGSQP
jgi:hypothetical protein